VGGPGLTEHGNVGGAVQDHDGGEPVRPVRLDGNIVEDVLSS
jgi:hypothetical protein